MRFHVFVVFRVLQSLHLTTDYVEDDRIAFTPSAAVLSKLSAFKARYGTMSINKTDDDYLICASLLECMLNFALNATFSSRLEQAIQDCMDDDALYYLGKYYRDYLILPSQSVVTLFVSALKYLQ